MEDKTGRTPKPGEIVMHNHRPTANGGHKQSPAIVHSVSPEGANLTVFGLNGQSIVTKVKEGAKPGEWQWPDDAAKTAAEPNEAPKPVLVLDPPAPVGAPPAELDPEA